MRNRQASWPLLTLGHHEYGSHVGTWGWENLEQAEDGKAKKKPKELGSSITNLSHPITPEPPFF